jgi:hypothetical protein
MKALIVEKPHPFRRKLALLILLLSIAGMVIGLLGCGRPPETASADAAAPAALGADLEPEERPYFEAAKPFAEAIAARDYSKAFDHLSSHARSRMSPNQFVAPDDDATQKRNEASAINNVSPEQFPQLLSATEKEYGKPAKLAELNVYSTDPVVLGGKGKTMEARLDAMFAIGMMPDSVPADLRKASLRSKLLVELSPEQLAETAKAHQMTPEKLKADPDFQPYLTLKMVLVQDAGHLKIGYFEFLPPGVMD